MSTYCKWVIAREYHDGPMSGVALRSSDQSFIFFRALGWDAEQWQRVFAVAPIRNQTAHQLFSVLEKLESRKEPFWLPGPVTHQMEVSAAWQSALADAFQSERWALVESHDLLDSVTERDLSAEQREIVSTCVEKNMIKDIAGGAILQSFIDSMRDAT